MAVEESERTHTLRSGGAFWIAKAIPVHSPSATEARFPRKPPSLSPLSLVSWMKTPEAISESLPDPSEKAIFHPSLVS